MIAHDPIDPIWSRNVKMTLWVCYSITRPYQVGNKASKMSPTYQEEPQFQFHIGFLAMYNFAKEISILFPTVLTNYIHHHTTIVTSTHVDKSRLLLEEHKIEKACTISSHRTSCRKVCSGTLLHQSLAQTSYHPKRAPACRDLPLPFP